jgi:hypothetical protein
LSVDEWYWYNGGVRRAELWDGKDLRRPIHFRIDDENDVGVRAACAALGITKNEVFNQALDLWLQQSHVQEAINQGAGSMSDHENREIVTGELDETETDSGDDAVVIGDTGEDAQVADRAADVVVDDPDVGDTAD